MNDNNKLKTVLYTYIVDDGWHLPYEVIEEIEYRIEEAASEAFKRVRREHYRHKGEWLTAEVAKKYAAKSWVYRVVESNRYCGKVREIGKELQDLYGVTELEAINILFEHNISDYLNKYYRIQHMIPNNINQQDICDEVAYEYLLAM